MNYWLLKSEPTCFSIDDLHNAPQSTTHWDGVRNYQARNFIRSMKPGDQAFYYHSNCTPPGIAGIVKIISEPYPDFTAFDPDSEHPDLKSDPNDPRWFMVDVQYVSKFPHLISLEELKQQPALGEMIILRKGNRLSITPVTEKQWNLIVGWVKTQHFDLY